MRCSDVNLDGHLDLGEFVDYFERKKKEPEAKKEDETEQEEGQTFSTAAAEAISLIQGIQAPRATPTFQATPGSYSGKLNVDNGGYLKPVAPRDWAKESHPEP